MKSALIATGLVVIAILGFVVFDESEIETDGVADVPRDESPILKNNSNIVILHDAPFAKSFGVGDITSSDELALIQLAFQDYLSFVKAGQRSPIGDNRDFVKVLTGGNLQRIAPIPPGHPRINSAGELVDRGGVPFAIHPLSQTLLEVRAAGEDGLLWTDDDVVNLTPKGRDLKQKLNER